MFLHQTDPKSVLLCTLVSKVIKILVRALREKLVKLYETINKTQFLGKVQQ